MPLWQQSNLTTGRRAIAHGRFSGIRQMASVCTPPNTCFLGPTRVKIPNSIWIGSAIFAQLTAEHPHTLQYATPSPPPENCPFPFGDLGHHLIHVFLGSANCCDDGDDDDDIIYDAHSIENISINSVVVFFCSLFHQP